MLRLKMKQRAVLVDKLPDLANLAVAGLVFGQLLSAGGFSFRIALGGVAIWFLAVGTAIRVAGEDV